MKNILTLLFTLIIHSLSAQNQFVYEYENNLTNYTDDYILGLGDDISYFTEKNAVLNRIYLKKAYKTGRVDMNNMKRSSKMNIVCQKFNNEIFLYKAFGANVLLVFENEDFEWKISDETKQEGEKKLHKATTHYGGRDWVAWYNMEIPIQEGPYVFTGLPGLIEQVHDSENIHSFILKGKVNEPYEQEFLKVENPSNYTKTSMSDFLILLEEAKKNPSEFLSTHSNILSLADVEITPEMKKAYNEKTRKKLEIYTIERSEPTQ